MSNNRSREALLEFLDYLAEKGLMAKNTAMARKAASNKVLSVLPDEMTSDVTAVDLNDAMSRFQNLEGKNYTPGSLSTYRSRVRAALDDFESYLANPMGFRPKLQSRETKQKSQKSDLGLFAVEGGKAQFHIGNKQPSTPPGAGAIVPVFIRQDLTVYIQGLPYDLTEAEARKIANVVLAMASAN